MRFTDLLISAATVTAVAAVPASKATTSIKKRQSTFQFTGVSEAGGEFGEGNIPGVLGTDYIWPVHSSIDTLAAAGMNTFRIPLLMERIIPNAMTGAVEENYAAGLDDIVNYVTSKGAYAIIDPHNYGRYYGNVISSTSDFQAFWTTIASRYRDNSLVIFDTNNEYHDMDNALVAQLNQAAIDGIRAAGATSQYIFVEGNSWSGAWSWVSSGTATDMVNLSDPQNKIIYEMHQYLDSDSSGTSTTCVSSTIGQERITEATAWLKANGKKGIIGETAGGVNSDCISAVTGMLQYMENNSDVWSGWLWWGGGPWWGDYIYSMEPPDGTAYTGFLPSITQFL